MVTPRRLLLCVLGLCSLAGAARADTVFYTTFAAWSAAASSFRTLDFDGDLVLSATDNFSQEGVVFGPFSGSFFLSEFNGQLLQTVLSAPFGPAPVINALFTAPVHSVAASGPCFSGCSGPFSNGNTRVSVYDTNGLPLVLGPLPAGPNFFGVVSDVPIGGITFEGIEYSISLDDFHLGPIPEPGTALLLGAGIAAIAARRRA